MSKMVLKNYYRILGLETSRVSIEEIKIAYRQAAKKYHPDLNVGDALAEEKIKDINEAYRILSTPSSKRKYDRIWNSRFAKGQKAFTGKGKKGTILNMFLGNIEREERQTKTANRGEDIVTQITITLQEAFYGMERMLSIRTAEGKLRKLSVTIPKGIREGEKIRLIGQGQPGENGGKNGDLFLQIHIEDSKYFQLKGRDLYTKLLLTPWEAALGTRASITSIDDKTKVYIPQGIQSGEKIKIAGKGYQDGNGVRGDLIAEIKIVVPKQINEQEKELYKKLNEISDFDPRNEKKA